MPDRKISQLDDLDTPAGADELAIVDKSDTSSAPSGTTKRITFSDLFGNLTVNVKDHGAVGDGTTNDTVAIAAAIDAAKDVPSATLGGVVYFPAGTYLTDTITDFGYGMEFRGDGRLATVIKSRTGSSVFAYTSGSIHSVVWSDLSVEVESGAGHCIHLGSGLSFVNRLGIDRVNLTADTGNCVFDEEGTFESVFRHVATDGNDDHWDLVSGNTTMFDTCILGAVAAAKCGFKIRSGSPKFLNCNGVNQGGGTGSKWAEVGSSSFGVPTFDHCNFEEVGNDGYGVHLLNSSYANFYNGCTFVQGADTGVVAIQQDGGALAAGFGVIDPTTRFIAGSGSWKNSWPIHASNSNFIHLVLGDHPLCKKFWDDAAAGTRGTPRIASESNLSPDDSTTGTGRAITMPLLTVQQVFRHTGSRIGFYNAAVVAQPAANADTSGATLPQLETEVNELKAALRALGLIAP